MADEFIMFASGDGKVRITCRFEHETLWLPQTIIQHIKAIYVEGELEQNATCKFY